MIITTVLKKKKKRRTKKEEWWNVLSCCCGVTSSIYYGCSIGKGGDTQKIFVPDTCGCFNTMQYLSVRMEITVVKGIISLTILFLPENARRCGRICLFENLARRGVELQGRSSTISRRVKAVLQCTKRKKQNCQRRKKKTFFVRSKQLKDSETIQV